MNACGSSFLDIPIFVISKRYSLLWDRLHDPEDTSLSHLDAVAARQRMYQGPKSLTQAPGCSFPSRCAIGDRGGASFCAQTTSGLLYTKECTKHLLK